MFLDPAKFRADFCADLPTDQAQFLARSQMPVAGAVFNARLTVAAWHDKPSYFIIATQDRALDPQVAFRMAHRAGSALTLVKASHAVQISHPREVALMIEAVARAIN